MSVLAPRRCARAHGLLFSAIMLLLSVLAQAQDCSQSKPCATGCCSKFGYCGTGSDFCGAGNCVANCDFKLGCDSNNPCKSGCCSKFGFCGLGPDYCSPENCVAGCNSKAYCDPGGYGKYAEISTCPLNVCCSKWGFCGITAEFCGTKKVQRPSSVDCPNHGLTRVVGYYESWSTDRPCNKVVPERIPLGVYTHLNYAFATVDPRTYEVRPAVASDKEMMVRLTDLKKQDPGLKVFIAIGGWTFNDPGPTATTFSDIARDSNAQQAFIMSLIKFIQDYNFDGVDIDWEYPRADDRSGRPEDFANFPNFIANLKAALKTTGGRDGLSITLPVSYWYLQHFDIKKLVENVDFFNMMSYDLHGTWDANSKWLGNYLNAHTNLTEITEAMDLLWRNNIDPSKVTLGTAFYGRAFTASSPACTSPGCTFSSGARAGPCSGEVSVLLNSEIVDIQASKSLSPAWDKAAAVKIQTFDGNQWVAYDDADTLKQKVDFAKSQCMGGVMVWAVSHDTSDGRFSRALGQATGLKMSELVVRASPLNSQIRNYHDQCKWTGCKESCPDGWVRMMRDDKWKKRDPEPMRDNTGCDDLDPPREFCCPPQSVPSGCGWYSHNGNGKCTAGCPSDYVEVGSMSVACKSGSQTACCKRGADSLKLYEQCSWNCGKDYVCSNTEVAASNLGSGGQKCKFTENEATPFADDKQYAQKYCCSQSDVAQWSDCDWYSVGIYKDTRNNQGGFCPGGCPDGKYRIALDESSTRCPAGGRLARCCSANYADIVKRSDPEAGAWEAAMRYWINNNDCSYESDLWRRDLIFGNVSDVGVTTPNINFLSARAGLVDDEKIKQFGIMFRVVYLIYNNYGSSPDVKNLWNNFVVPQFPGLTITNVIKIINRSIELFGLSFNTAINDLLCRMQYFSDSMAQSPPPRGCVCARQDCCPENDLECQGDNEVYTKRSMISINGTNLPSVNHHIKLDKRGKRKEYEVDWIGIASWIIWARSYRSPSAIPQGDPVRFLAYQRPSSSDCTITSLERTIAVLGVHEAEHVIERQNVLSHFFTDMGTGSLPNGMTPGRTLRPFSVGFMNFLQGTNLIQPPPARGNPANSRYYDNTRPMDRIANALGSIVNRDPFVMLLKVLNELKARLVGRGNRATMWGVGYIDTLLNYPTYTQGATELQNAILTMEYHNEREVNTRLIDTANEVRNELALAETQYNAVVHGDQQQATLWWDYWIRAHYDNVRTRFVNQFTNLYTRLRSRFGNDPVAVRDLDRLYNIALQTSIDLAGLVYPVGGLP